MVWSVKGDSKGTCVATEKVLWQWSEGGASSLHHDLRRSFQSSTSLPWRRGVGIEAWLDRIWHWSKEVTATTFIPSEASIMMKAFKSEEGQARYEAAYAQMLSLWGSETEERWGEAPLFQLNKRAHLFPS